MTDAPLKQLIVQSLEFAHAAQATFFASLSEAERTANGTPDQWAPKDHLVHMNHWINHEIKRLHTLASGGAQPTASGEEFQQVNERVFEEWRERPWADVLAYSERTHAALLEALEPLTDLVIMEPLMIPAREAEPLITTILGSPYWHLEEHLATLYRERGNLPAATQVYESFAAQLDHPVTPAIVRGLTTYNLACFYALMGQPEKAVTLLSEALRLRPQLTEWSKEDPDFASVRETPAYQALYAAA